MLTDFRKHNDSHLSIVILYYEICSTTTTALPTAAGQSAYQTDYLFILFWKKEMWAAYQSHKTAQAEDCFFVETQNGIKCKKLNKKRNTVYQRVIISFSRSHQQRKEFLSCCRSRLAQSPPRWIPFTPKTSSGALRHSQEVI